MKPFKLFSGKPPAKTVNYLTLTPTPLIESEISSDGYVSLLVPRFTSKFWSKYFMTKTKKRFIHLKLDEYGSATWSNIDGLKTVEEICTILETTFGDRIQPVEESVTVFITGLFRNKFLTFKEISSTK